MRRRWLQWRIFWLHERIQTRRLQIRLLGFVKYELELRLQGRILAEQVVEYAKDLGVTHVEIESEREAGG